MDYADFFFFLEELIFFIAHCTYEKPCCHQILFSTETG